MIRILLAAAVLALPATAIAQPPAKGQPAEAEKKLADLEAKLQGLLKEIQSLRSAKPEAPKVAEKKIEKKPTTLRVVPELKDLKNKAGIEIEIEKLADLKDKLKGIDLNKLMELKGKGIKIELEKLAELKAKGLQVELEKLAELKGKLHLDASKMLELKGKLEKVQGAKEEVEKRVRVVEGPKKEGEKRVIVIDADGKKTERVQETKPAQGKAESTQKRVVVLDEKTGATVEGGPNFSFQYRAAEAANTVHLTRVTYTLSKDEAKVVADFLAAHAKAAVLETKVDGVKLIVTTTPDVQATIGGVVGLVTGKPVASAGNFTRWVQGFTDADAARKVYGVPVTPKTPAAPKKPAKPIEKDD